MDGCGCLGIDIFEGFLSKLYVLGLEIVLLDCYFLIIGIIFFCIFRIWVNVIYMGKLKNVCWIKLMWEDLEGYKIEVYFRSIFWELEMVLGVIVVRDYIYVFRSGKFFRVY